MVAGDGRYLGYAGDIRMVRGGESIADIRQQIEERFAVSENRARLIARDQVGKLNGRLTKRRSQEAGLDLYRWNTAGDERVRSTHKKLNNKICKWDNDTVYADSVADARAGNWKSRSGAGMFVGTPGQDIQCRCTSIPIVDDVIDEVDKEIIEENRALRPEEPKPVSKPRAKPVKKKKPVKPIVSKEKKPLQLPPKSEYKPVSKKIEINENQINSPANVIKRKKNYTDQEEGWLIGYKENFHKDMNNFLIDGTTTKDYSAKSLKEITGIMDSAVKKSALTKDVTIFRGMSGKNLSKSAIGMKGKTFKISGYQSTTTQESIAAQFAGVDKRNAAIFKLRVKKGTNAVNMDLFASGTNRGERELLFGRGHKIKVTGISTNKSGYTVIEGDLQ